ncbi:hypothetical protein L6164_024446 [Bauhinia variegata]|uniref:Uncharacterized protein n=1 Tax=Bauhinia variegata TaxID=167791 RepID=A0ACB9LXH1_BAUVA|nr:hypothetical protein L6164_024446 [Bauhinia variegata]
MDLNSSQATPTSQHDEQSSRIAQEENPKFALDLNYPVVDAKSGYKIVDGVINIDSDGDEGDIGDAGTDDLVDNADNSVAHDVDHSQSDKDKADNSVADDVDHSHNDTDGAHGHVDEQNNESHNN